MDAVMLLCDAAEEANGKLFILGGGWSVNRGGGDAPVAMGIAVKVLVPWHDANTPHPLILQLMTEDGDPVQLDGNVVRVDGALEVGRPPGLRQGTPLDAMLAINFPPLALPVGAYRWELLIDGDKSAEASFQVVRP